ncbi:MAG: FAD-dependent oxidoreductase, partial [Dehalococcoidia bacterium]|nr:FAD-dependent oxidoreductase [Dehalococcoidia bacterium]
EPGRIGKMELKNRIVQSAMGTSLEQEDGFVDDRIKDFYEERAKGGVGLIVMGIGAIDHPDGKVLPGQLGLSDDKFIPGLREMAEAVHRHGAKLAIQLQRGGKIATEDMCHGRQPVSSSAGSIPMGDAMQDMGAVEIPRLAARFANMPAKLETVELTVEQIHQIVEKFGEAARRVKEAGIDGVEIHAAHGYLLSEFLSRSCNKRTDEYGGDLKNRVKIVLEVVKAVRDRVGADYPVWIRMDGREFGLEEGITTEEGLELARMFEEAGVDAINVSGYGGIRGGFYDAPIVYPPGNLVSLAEGIKRVVNIPVIAVGRISAELGEEVLRRGKADFIAMARAILADPEYPNKVASGKMEDIRPCILCYHCVSQAFWGEPVFCAVNAAAGKEAELRIEPAKQPKKVLVVGGGPGGMESARVAALRGHDVTICDKGCRLGGSLVFASVANADNEDFLNYLIAQVGKLPITVKLGVEVTPALIEDIKPDVVILALGGNLTTPQLPGAALPSVISGKDLRQMVSGTSEKLSWWQKRALSLASALMPGLLSVPSLRRLTGYWMPLGKRVAIIGGDMVACELAKFLVERGREVTILESSTDMAIEMSIGRRWNFMPRLREAGVAMLKNVDFEEITPRGVNITDSEGEKQAIAADTVVLAGGMEPNKALLQQIEGKVPQIHLVGDCSELRLIHGAVEDGYRAALAI